METSFASSVLFASALAGAAMLGYGLIASWRRMLRGESRLLVGRMMQRLGIAPADVRSAGLDREMALANRRCVLCAAQQECAAWLDSGAREGYEKFCPNAQLLRNIGSPR